MSVSQRVLSRLGRLFTFPRRRPILTGFVVIMTLVCVFPLVPYVPECEVIIGSRYERVWSPMSEEFRDALKSHLDFWGVDSWLVGGVILVTLQTWTGFEDGSEVTNAISGATWEIAKKRYPRTNGDMIVASNSDEGRMLRELTRGAYGDYVNPDTYKYEIPAEHCAIMRFVVPGRPKY